MQRILIRRVAIAAAALVLGAALFAPAANALVGAPPDGGPTPSSLVNAAIVTPQDPDAPPPGANDFSCTPSAAHPTPVVLVHGTGFQMASNWRYLAPSLKAEGYCVFALNYGAGAMSGSYAVGPIRASAGELSAFVDEVLSATGAAEVDIIGHSQGGMMPRWYLKFLGGAAKVNALIGLSPSNHGTDLNGLSPLYTATLGGRGYCQGCDDQMAGSEFLAELNEGGDTVDGVAYTVIQTQYDRVVTPYQSAFLEGPNVTNINLQNDCALDFSDHANVAFDPIVRHHVLNALDPANATPAPCQLVAPGIQ